MLDFKSELEKFKPALEVDEIEEQIVTEDMRDIIDLIKDSIEDKGIQLTEKKDYENKEQ